MKPEKTSITMKNILTILFLFILAVTCVDAQSRLKAAADKGKAKLAFGDLVRDSNLNAADSIKIALLVGVGQYAGVSGWQPLNSKNDVELLQKTLLQQGFTAPNIITLQEHHATKQAILTTFREKFLAAARPGGTAVCHFSGHGQQIQDDNGDEADGYDEALAPYDSQREYKPGVYTGQNHLRDDELGALLIELRRKLGPTGHLLVLLDACHSGTGTRGLAVVRGTDVVMAAPDYIQKNTRKAETINELGSEGGDKDGNLAPMVSLFSSSPQELSYEYDDDGRHYGLLCYMFAKSLATMPSEATYRALAEKIRNDVKNYIIRQTPQAEGELDRQILGGKFLGRTNYFRARNLISPQLVLLDAGQLQGLLDSTVVVFYPPDTRDTLGKPPLAFGVIESAKPLDCDVSLDRPLGREQAKSAWVFIRQQRFGDLRLRLKITLSEGALRDRMLEFVRERPYIELVDSQPDLLIESSNNLAQLFQRDETVLYRQSSSNLPVGKVSADLRQSVSAWLRANFLRNLETSSEGIEAEMQFFYGNNPDAAPEISQIVVGQKVNIVVRNTGSKPFYFNILDIQPDNLMNIVIPKAGRPAVEYYLEPGKTFVSRDHDVTRPLGREVLKIIATPEPVDLSSLVATQGASLRGRETTASPLEKLLALYCYPDSQTRSAAPSAAAPIGAGTIGTVVMEIVGK